MRRLGTHQLDSGSATDKQGLVFDASTGLWVPQAVVLGLTSANASVTIFDNGDGTLDLAAAGGGSGATYHGCSGIRTTAQGSIATTGTAVQLNDADEWDTDSIHNPATNNTRFTIPAGFGGWWNFTAYIQWPAASLTRRTGWAKNGTQYDAKYVVQIAPASGTALLQAASIDLQLAAGDYIECIVLASATASISTARVTCRYLGT